MNESINAATLLPTVAIARTQGSAPSASPESADPQRFAAMLGQLIQGTDGKTVSDQPGLTPSDARVSPEGAVGSAESQSSLATELSINCHAESEEKVAVETVDQFPSNVMAGLFLQAPVQLLPQPETQANNEAMLETMVSFTPTRGELTAGIEQTQETLDSRTPQTIDLPNMETSIALESQGLEGESLAQPKESANNGFTQLQTVNKALPADHISMAQAVLAVMPEGEERTVDSSPKEISYELQETVTLDQNSEAVGSVASSSKAVIDNHRTAQSFVIPLSEVISRSLLGYRGASLRTDHAGQKAVSTQRASVALGQNYLPTAAVSAGIMVQPELTNSWYQRLAPITGSQATSGRSAWIAEASTKSTIQGLQTSIASEQVEVSKRESLQEAENVLSMESSAFESIEPLVDSNDLRTFEGILQGLDEAATGSLNEGMSQSADLIVDPLTSMLKPASAAASEVQYTPRGVPYTPQDVVTQIIQGSHVAVRDGAVEMKLHLEPAELGRVELKIVYEQNVVNTHFVAESEAVKKIIETYLPQLRNALQESGVHADNFSVSVNNGWTSSGNGQSEREHQPSHYQPSSYRWNDSGEELGEMPVETYWTGHVNLKA